MRWAALRSLPKAGHVAQPEERFTQAHGQGDAGQAPALEAGQHLLLQGLLARRRPTRRF